MKFGLFCLFSDFGQITQDQLFREVLEEIQFAETLGFDSVWLPEHHFAIYGMLGDPMVLAAAIAQRTRRMHFGTAIMVLPFQYPLRLAEDAALTDALACPEVRRSVPLRDTRQIRPSLGFWVESVWKYGNHCRRLSAALRPTCRRLAPPCRPQTSR